MTTDPSSVEIELDHHSADYAKRWREISDHNLAHCPVAHTSAHGGFWLLSDHATVSDAARDDATFSSFHDVTGDVNGYEGIAIPPSPVFQVPIELDPPELNAYRAILNPLFSPKRSRALEPQIRELATTCFDSFCESGSADLVVDLGTPVPAILTMRLLGLPLEDASRHATATHEVSYLTPDNEGYTELLERYFALVNDVYLLIQQRRTDPRDDIISTLTQAEINGVPLDDEQITNVCTLIIAGGVDTTTSLFAETLVWLDQHPEQRQRLIDEPELIPRAIEEFLRFFAPVQMLARTATRDVRVRGQHIAAGDRVQLSWAAANRDPEVFDAPSELRLDRFPNRHTSFGLGLHRCLGSNLARAQMSVLLSEVLTRIPDYTIDHDRAEAYPSIGLVNGWISLPATFTPTPTGV